MTAGNGKAYDIHSRSKSPEEHKLELCRTGEKTPIGFQDSDGWLRCGAVGYFCGHQGKLVQSNVGESYPICVKAYAKMLEKIEAAKRKGLFPPYLRPVLLESQPAEGPNGSNAIDYAEGSD